MLTGLKKRVENLSDTFNKDIEYIKNRQSILKNTVTEINLTHIHTCVHVHVRIHAHRHRHTHTIFTHIFTH